MSFELQDNITKSYNKVDNFLDGLEKNSKEEKLDFKAAFKEWKIIVRKIEIARDEYEKNTEEYKELTSILEKATTEYQELERTIIQAWLSEWHISQEERKSIMLELSDIIQIEENQKDITDNFRFIDKVGELFDKFGWWVSEDRVERIIEESNNLRETDSIKIREEQAVEITKNAFTFFNEAKNKQLTWDNTYQLAFKEELNKQKSEFDLKYQDYLVWKIEIDELESEMDDIDLLNIDSLIGAISEWASFFIWDLFSDDIPNIIEMKKRLWKMNLIYLASRASNISWTETFKEERDIVANKIIEIEQWEWIGIWEHETKGVFTYDINKIKNQILSWNFNNIDKYELFYYIKNEHNNFSNDTIKQLLTEYPRNFIEYLSVKFLKDKWMLSVLFNEEKNSENVKFLESISNIDKVLNLNSINDLNLATNEFKTNSEEYSNAEEKLNDPILRKKFLETISKDPDNLNQYLQELKIYAIELEFQNISPDIKNKLLNTNEILSEEETNEKIESYKNDLITGIKQGYSWDKLMWYLLSKWYSRWSTEAISTIHNTVTIEYNGVIQELNNEIKKTKSLSLENKEKIEVWLKNEIINNETFYNRTESLAILNDEDFETLRDKLSQWETFNEIDKYFSENNEEYKELLERQSIKNIIIEKDFREIESPIYQDYQIDNNWEWSFLISEENKEKIEITEKEAELVENNPEALKNLIDMKEKLDILWLDFVWKYRNDIITAMQNTHWFSWMKMDTSWNYIDNTEFNNLLNYILTLLWEKPANSYSWNISKILDYSKVWWLDDKKDNITKYGIIWTQFKELWYIWGSSIDTDNMSNMQDYKQTINNYEQKKEA